MSQNSKISDLRPKGQFFTKENLSNYISNILNTKLNDLDVIIEPFAGSARYSLKYWRNDVLLVDKYSVIIEVWNYLINASEKDILGLPKMKIGECIDNFNLSEICSMKMSSPS